MLCYSLAQLLYMTMQADITIFLPVYNGANFIQEAIESVLTQTYTNWKFLIVDNCSTDNTAAICKPYLADSRFKYVLNETNLGMYGNFHKALNLCDTTYFSFLSHDDIYARPDAIEEARGLLEADDTLAMINTPLLWLDQHSKFISSFGMASSTRKGKIKADVIAKSCIIQCRNLYGVAVLSRTKLGQQLQLDKRLHQAADINFFVGIASVSEARYVYVVEKHAYAVRFHQTNNTLHQYATLIDEMNMIAKNHHIQLNKFEKISQVLNSYKVRLGKWLFYAALNRRTKAVSA
jgi:glycosyltransferase involved in cell wall biosynthesis